MTDYVTRIRNLRQNSPLQWACLIGLRVNEWRQAAHIEADIIGVEHELDVSKALLSMSQTGLCMVKRQTPRWNVYSAKPAVREAVEAVLSEIVYQRPTGR